jgi:hypothetical protein
MREPRSTITLRELLVFFSAACVVAAFITQWQTTGALAAISVIAAGVLLFLGDRQRLVRVTIVCVTALGAAMFMFWCAKGWVLGLNASQTFGLWPSEFGIWGAAYLAGGAMAYLAFVHRPPAE